MRSLLLATAVALALAAALQTQQIKLPPHPTPLAVGTHVPSFSVIDQFGKVRDFANLTGPKGLVFFFYKSAEW
jgi:cytochrome oxidase Cu insertion factor (SCO1/SenC/PrrC family)